VPDWFSWENQGAGIPVVDVDGDGQLELVVLLVDNPSQQTRASTSSAGASERTGR
jgi:hypothetical protein